jgi:hypothetical protein
MFFPAPRDLSNWFSFRNFKFSSFPVVLFACELISAMGAPTTSEDLLHKTSEKAAEADATASSV